MGSSSDTLGVGKGTLLEWVTLPEGVGASPTLEVHASIVVDRLAWAERAPVVTSVLLGNTLVVCVGWAREEAA